MSRADQALSAAVEALTERKAEHLVVLKLRDDQAFTDHFLICSGQSDRQVKSLADDVVSRVNERTDIKPRIEGYDTGEWVLLDYGDFIVHVFSENARQYYRLESLWLDSEQIDHQTLLAG